MLERLKQPSTLLLCMIIMVSILLDQLTKLWAIEALRYESVEVLPILNWTLAYNSGAAFSFLSNDGGWQRWFLLGISVVASIAFLIWMFKTPKGMGLLRYSLAFLIGGAVGNLIDRAYQGFVIDFISVHWENNYFPTFNIADMAITFGAFLMIVDMLFSPQEEKS